MSVLNGFTKYKNYKADSNGNHKLQSFWTSTDTVHGTDQDQTPLTTTLSNMNTPTFSEASTRANLAGSGESMNTILGKIKKYFSDLGTAAFKDTTDTYSGTGTDPVTGKAVKAAIGELDVTEVGGSGKYLTTISETDGKISASAETADTTVTQNSAKLITSGAVWTAIDNLPEPLIFKGTLGASADNPTITSLPTASSSNEGWTYLVITDGTYASQAARVGDKFACATLNSGTSYQWVKFKAGDPDTDTWRNIKVNGTEKLGNGISSGGVDFVDGTNTTVAFDATGNKVSVSVPAVSSSSAGVAPKGATVSTQSQSTKFLREDGSWSAPSYTENTDRYVNSASFADDSTSSANSPVKMTLTRAGSDTATVTGNLPKVSSSSAGVVPKGASVSSQSQSTKFLREDGTWAAPSYTTDTNTHRPIQMNGTQILGDNTTALNLKAGTNVSLSNSSGTVTITSTDTNTTYSLTQDGTDGHKITLTPSSGTAQTVTIPDNNTTYTFAQGTNNGEIKITPSTGSATTVTPKGLSDLAYIAKDGTSSTKFLRGDGTWQSVTSGVSGVKGNAESNYRTGDVNITPANIGAIPLSGSSSITGSLSPETNGDSSLGTSSKRWSNLYAVNINIKSKAELSTDDVLLGSYWVKRIFIKNQASSGSTVYTTTIYKSSSVNNTLQLPSDTGIIPVAKEVHEANYPSTPNNDTIYFLDDVSSIGYLSYPIQDNGSATDLTNGYLPTGQTIKSYLNSNRFFKCYWAGETQTVTNGDTIDLSNFGSTDMLYIHFNRYGHQGYVFGFKSGFGGNNGMRILFGNNYFITLTNPNDNLNTLKIQTDSAFPNIVCNIYKLA